MPVETFKSIVFIVWLLAAVVIILVAFRYKHFQGLRRFVDYRSLAITLGYTVIVAVLLTKNPFWKVGTLIWLTLVTAGGSQVLASMLLGKWRPDDRWLRLIGALVLSTAVLLLFSTGSGI
ncbi:hypothetical protein L248_1376 [Schleiferilactobacillus shenzhenensis LY-73]|uniref:Uncharacterized protein n=1 Tax=Schleiferilactobacillus shenzhenensis LY-73 TaxID=1231336 RepID=U4TPZ3_9LACO|nr:hypothetical protein L248_1376 [Schleiferilactobacillus shenzhenensis LY-73]